MVNKKIIGSGNTADVYEWDEGKALKLFKKGYPENAVRKEFNNSIAVNGLNFLKPKAYEMIQYENQIGIIYDRIEGESLLDQVMRTGDVEECAMQMEKLHKCILENKIENVPDYKEFLEDSIKNTYSLNDFKREEALRKVYDLSDGDTLCHGDFHPGNILLTDGQAVVIDFMNVCRGTYLYDVARTVYLIEYSPIPDDCEEKEVLIQFKKALADRYLEKMDVKRKLIGDYLEVISVARMGEINER